MSEPQPVGVIGYLGAIVAVLGLLGAGLAVIVRAALRIGSKETADEQIAKKLERIETKLDKLAEGFATHLLEDAARHARMDERIGRNGRGSYPEIGE